MPTKTAQANKASALRFLAIAERRNMASYGAEASIREFAQHRALKLYLAVQVVSINHPLPPHYLRIFSIAFPLASSSTILSR